MSKNNNKNKNKSTSKKVLGGLGNALLNIAGAKNSKDAKKKLKHSLLG